MKKFRYFLFTLLSFAALFVFKVDDTISAEELTYEYSEMLGYSYSTNQTIFRLYSSSAIEVNVNVEGKESQPLLKNATDSSLWEVPVYEDLNGKEYSYTIKDVNGDVYENVLDPYGKYINKSGTKNVVFDESVNNFEGWDNQTKFFSERDNRKVIYGLNVSGFTKDNSWTGTESNRGKLLGLIESDISSSLIGFDYVKSLGITYLELSRVNDINSPFAIDNAFVVGELRNSGELELRKVVNEYYLNNIGIILTFDYKEWSSVFLDYLQVIDKISYFDDEGQLDLDKQMTKEYIFDLLSYYVRNYKISGIRIENLSDYSKSFVDSLIKELKKINENIMIYGSGAGINQNYAGENTLKEIEALKILNGSLNYSLLGNMLNKTEKGILLGNYGTNSIESLKHALLSGVNNGQIDYSLVKGINHAGDMGITSSYQLINYLGNKNGLSMYDKLLLDSNMNKRIAKEKIELAYGVMMMSGGIPYIYSGEEFMMSYPGKSDSSICDANDNLCYYTKQNEKVINWRQMSNKDNIDLVKSIKALINYRKTSQSVAQTNPNIIKNYVDIYTNEDCPGLIGFIRNYPNAKSRDTEKVVVMFNFSNNDYTISMPGKGWYGLHTYNYSSRDGDNLILKSNSIYAEYKEKEPKVNQWVTLLLVIGLISAIYVANIFLNRKLVEKKGYDINNVKKKYRLFIRKNKTQPTKSEENKEEDNSNN